MPKTVSRHAGSRYILKKDVEPALEGKFYPADDAPKPRKRSFKPSVPAVRKSITPGTVLIVLTGRFRGKRVIFIKQLASGLLLVTGPYEVNGVPLRRINQSYVIATSKKIDISKIAVPASVNDDFFKAPKSTAKAGKTDFLKLQDSTAALPEQKKAIQKAVDTSIAAAISAEVKAYLKSTFALAKGDKPHEMNF